MATTHCTLTAPPPFDFVSAATSHGWRDLAPTVWDGEQHMLQRVERLAGGRVVLLEIRGSGTPATPALDVTIHHAAPLSDAEQQEIQTAVGHMFRLDEDFSAFYVLCEEYGAPWTQLTVGKGRLLRSPTLFEDVVKTICTTNTTWSNTLRMVAALVAALGEPCEVDSSRRAFPTPAAIAAAPLEIFTREVRMGYRGEYIRLLGERVVSGTLDLEPLRDASRPAREVKRDLLAIKGVGPYAAHTLLMLLGRYGELAIDSELRTFMRRKYFDGRPPTDAEIRACYERWGAWKYLAAWFDLAAFYAL